MKVLIGTATLASIHSIGIGASKDDVTPVITQIALTRRGDTLKAMATDRYMILAGTYSDVEFEDWTDGDTILVDPNALKRALDIKKANKNGILPIAISKNDHGAVSAVVDVVSLVDLGSVAGTFPPVDKLLERTEEPNGASVLALRPDFIARLAKVLPPEAKPERNRAWRFEFRSIENPGKPQPVYAVYSNGDTYELEALIQPNLVRS